MNHSDLRIPKAPEDDSKQVISKHVGGSIKQRAIKDVEDILDEMDDLMREYKGIFSDKLHNKVFHLFWYI